jgi:hypothetical protein
MANVLKLPIQECKHDDCGYQSTSIGEPFPRLNKFFGTKMLSELNGALCRAYAKQSSTDSMARRDLEGLRSAESHHRKEGLRNEIISVVLPERRPPRERSLERDEAAKLLWAAWRRPKCKHVAKFILVALYAGRRASVVCGASFQKDRVGLGLTFAMAC